MDRLNVCDICDKQCASLHGLNIHMAKAHPSDDATSLSRYAELPSPYVIEVNPETTDEEEEDYVSEVAVKRIKKCIDEKNNFHLISQFGTSLYQSCIVRRICVDMNLMFVSYLPYYARLQNLDITTFIKDVLESSRKNGKGYVVHITGKIVFSDQLELIRSAGPIAFSEISDTIPTQIR